jgi:ABC-type lipoprotein export system ATPase subunit
MNAKIGGIMIELRGLFKTYKTSKTAGVQALQDINLTLSDLGMVFILGKSGSGKTTLLNVTGGLDSFDKGEIVYNGQCISGKSDRRLTQMRADLFGFVFQDFLLFDDISVQNNMKLAIELQGGRATHKEIQSALTSVGLDGYGKRKAAQLSSGQKQRVGIARALLKRSKVIFADEPTGNLDSENSKNIFSLLRSISRKELVVVVSHDEDAARAYADRIIKLEDGRVISDTLNDNEEIRVASSCKEEVEQ